MSSGSILRPAELEQLRRAFLGETEEDVALIEEALLALERRPADRESLATVFRKFHSLKGGAACVGYHRLAEFAHLVEDRLQALRQRAKPVTRDNIALLLRAVDAVREAFPFVTAGRDELPVACEALRAEMEMAPRRRSTRPSAEPVPAEVCEVERRADAVGTLRVDIGKLDELLNLTTEIAITRARLETAIESDGSPKIAEAYLPMDRQLARLHYFITDLRMVPLAPLFRQFARVVRDIAAAQGKEVVLDVVDQGVEVDTSVLEQLRAPLTHLVRNAISHGIEPPQVRENRGKRPAGRVVLRAQHEEGAIAVTVQDDGAGLDRRRIIAKAREAGLVAAEQALSDREIDRLIFHHGFSTAHELTSTSGRGVGMDVVLQHLDKLRGAIDVESHTGEGARFTLRVPLTLAIIEAFLASVAGETLVIPVAGVVRCLDVPPALSREAADGVLDWKGQAIPFVRLRSALGLEAAPASSEVVFIVQREGGPVGIAVDRLIGRRQIVVKPGGPFFTGLPAFSGLTILGDGRVAPIVSVAGVLHDYLAKKGDGSESGTDG